MQVLEKTKNWIIGLSPIILEDIHLEDVNIAIYEREIDDLSSEINSLVEQNVEFRASGNVKTIETEMKSKLGQSNCNRVIDDINELLLHFKKVTNTDSFRLLLTTVNTNMCRKFHTDINDLRMLCTYSGPGTLWLTEDNVNRKAMDVNGSTNESIVIDDTKVQQAKTGSVVLLKGAIYPQNNTNAIVHRSPTIEETGEKRLLLRTDTNTSLNLWK